MGGRNRHLGEYPRYQRDIRRRYFVQGSRLAVGGALYDQAHSVDGLAARMGSVAESSRVAVEIVHSIE